MARVGVVIVNYNGRAYVLDCLRSITGSTFRASLVVVIDNCSGDGSADLVADEFPEFALVRNPVNLGFTGGANLGIRHCLELGCDAVVLLNPDTVIEPSTLGALADAVVRHPRALLAPAIFHFDRPTLGGSYAGRLQWWRGRMGSRFLNQPADRLPTSDLRVETASFCCVLIPAAAALEVGLLDDAYFLYFEDADYLVRAARAGLPLWYVPAARLLHRESSSTGGRQSALALYYYVRNRHYFVRKFQRGQPVYLVFLAYSLVDVMLRAGWALVQGKLSLTRAVLRGAIHGWAGRTGQAAP